MGFTEGKIFVGGLGPDVTEDDLKAHFGPYGPLADMVVMRDKITRNCRGFGFVTFEDRNIAERVVKEKHEIKGKLVEAKLAVPRAGEAANTGGSSEGGGGSNVRDANGQPICKVFVGGLSPQVQETDLRTYFAGFGTVTEANVMIDHATQNSRGYGFVTFDSSSPVDEIMRNRENHSIKGKEVEIKRAFPRHATRGDNNNRGGGRGGPMRDNMGGRGGGGFNGGGGGGGFNNGGMNYLSFKLYVSSCLYISFAECSLELA